MREEKWSPTFKKGEIVFVFVPEEVLSVVKIIGYYHCGYRVKLIEILKILDKKHPDITLDFETKNNGYHWNWIEGVGDHDGEIVAILVDLPNFWQIRDKYIIPFYNRQIELARPNKVQFT
jgi:hypothetical protein